MANLYNKAKPVNNKSKPGIRVRQQAVRVLLAVIHDYRSLDDALIEYAQDVDEVDQPLLQALCYGVMRWHLQLRAWLEQLADRPADTLKPAVEVMILLGLYQLKYTRIPAHAAIHATVDCAPSFKSTRAKGLINAVLRQFQRLEKDEKLISNAATQYAHQPWMLEVMQQDWPNHWLDIIDNNNRQAPMTLRLDLQQISRDDYLAQLQAQGMAATAHEIVETAIVLQQAVDVTKLPGFAQGLVSVQDAAAQLAVPLLECEASHRILDACAAPGGKTAHILQQVGPAYLAAMDNSALRLQRLVTLFERIQLSAEMIEGDAAKPEEWWDGKPYDRILLDAPCSASGVIRRHPDIKHLRSKRALEKIVKRQAKILDAMWGLLAPGGRLLYATCSIFKAENEFQVSSFIERHVDAQLQDMPTNWGHGKTGRQILPGEDSMDGFYFAALVKQ